MQRSTYWVNDKRAGMASRSAVGTTWMACSGKLGSTDLADVINVSAINRLEFNASLPPRRMVALPVLKHSDAASAVTLGRDS